MMSNLNLCENDENLTDIRAELNSTKLQVQLLEEKLALLLLKSDHRLQPSAAAAAQKYSEEEEPEYAVGAAAAGTGTGRADDESDILVEAVSSSLTNRRERGKVVILLEEEEDEEESENIAEQPKLQEEEEKKKRTKRRRRTLAGSVLGLKRTSSVKKIAKKSALGLGDVLIRQIKSVDLRSRFGLKYAVGLGLLILLLKLAFVVWFTIITQRKCSLSSDLVSADYDNTDYYTGSVGDGQYLCHSASVDELDTNLFEYRDLDPKEFGKTTLGNLDLSRYGFDHIWTAHQGGLPFHYLTAFFGGYNLKRTAYIHECAEYCGQGDFVGGATYVAGFAAKTIDGSYECICMSDQLFDTDFLQEFARDPNVYGPDYDGVPAPPCLMDYRAAVNDDDDDDDDGSNSSHPQKIEFKSNCTVSYKDYETSWEDRAYWIWGRKLFEPSPIIVFSKRPQTEYATCRDDISEKENVLMYLSRATPTPNETVLEDACWIHRNYLPFVINATTFKFNKCDDYKNCEHRVNTPPIVCFDNSTNCGPCYQGSFCQEEGIQSYPLKEKADGAFTWFRDGVLQEFGKSQWVPCLLPGFKCEDYGSSNCPISSTNNGEVRVDPFASKKCDREIPTCIGITSVTSITCPLVASTIGAGMGYLDLVEVVLVVVLVTAFMLWVGQGKDMYTIMRNAVMEDDEEDYVEKDIKKRKESARKSSMRTSSVITTQTTRTSSTSTQRRQKQRQSSTKNATNTTNKNAIGRQGVSSVTPLVTTDECALLSASIHSQCSV